MYYGKVGVKMEQSNIRDLSFYITGIIIGFIIGLSIRGIIGLCW